jgi:hypothetical protein
MELKNALDAWKKAKPLALTKTGVSNALRTLPAKPTVADLEKVKKVLLTTSTDKRAQADKKVQACIKDILGAVSRAIGQAGKELADTKDGLAKAKAALESMASANQGYLDQMTEIKERIKSVKEEIKVLEAEAETLNSSALKKEIDERHRKLASAEQAGSVILRDHESWYLKGPRRGTGEVLTKFGLKKEDLNAADSDLFTKALFVMSSRANDVGQVYAKDVKGAADALQARLANLESATTKREVDALKDIRARLAHEVEEVRKMCQSPGGMGETKGLLEGLKAEDPERRQRLIASPSLISSFHGANNNRLGVLANISERVNRQVIRLKKTVPAAYATDDQVKLLLAELDSIAESNNKRTAADRAMIEECETALTNFQSQHRL